MSLPLTRPKTLLLAALFWLPLASAQEEADAQKLAEVRSRIQAVQKAMDADQRERDSARQQVAELERGIAAQQTNLAKLNAEIARQTQRVRETEKELQTIERRLRVQKNALGRQLRAAYITGEHEQTRLLLNQDRLMLLTRMLTYYDYLNRGRVHRIADLRGLGKKLQALLAAARTEGQRLDRLKREQQSALAALGQASVARKHLLAQIGQRLSQAAGELQALKDSERGLQKLLDRLRDSLADIPLDLGKGKSFGQLKGKLPWPLKGKLLAKFGAPKGVGKLTWDGLWIAAAEGAPVRAVARGRVAYTGWMRRYGLIAVLEHEGGYYSMYGHTQSVAIEAGEWVEMGGTIAAAGATGGHESSGVYFELRKGTTAVDPKDWLKR